MTSRVVFAALVCLLAGVAGASSVERIEPPSWWTGFVSGELQLAVYGEGAGRLDPAIDYPGVRIARIVRVGNPNYLFLYLDIAADTAPGSFDIAFHGSDGTHRYRYELQSKNPKPGHARGYSNADAIYLVTPDRFANGNPGNDDIAALGDPVNRSGWQDRHGGDIAGLQAHLDYIADMGFTAVWLNPVLENAMPRTSYHGYATTDFYRVDARFGSNEEYREFVTSARQRGIGVIMDMIANHCGREHWWLDDLPTPDWINNGGEYVGTTHERTAIQDPYAAEVDERAFADGWFVPAMPDLNQRNPLLADYLIQNSLWWIEYLGLAGIRQDTYPYADKHFMSLWTRRIMTEYPQFNIVGEQWTTDPIVLAYWQRGKVNHDAYVSHLPELMDFPLQDALRRALIHPERQHQSGWIELYRMLANDVVYAAPEDLVVFADNHDMSRVFTQLGEDYGLWKMAMTFVLTTRGTPQIYYGTEILMANRDSDDHGLIRSDFPGGWAGDRVNAFTGRGLGVRERDAQRFLKRLLNWRKTATAVHAGRLMHFHPHDGVYSYFRYDEDQMVMVALNKNEGVAELELRRYAELIDGYTHARDVLAGQRMRLGERLAVPARDGVVLELERANGSRAP